MPKLNWLFALLTVAITTSATALPGKTQQVDIQSQYALLQSAVCAQNWDTAIQAINSIIGSSEITSEYRQQLINYRSQLLENQRTNASFAGVTGCGAATESTNTVNSTSTQDGYIPAERWQRALDAVAAGAGRSGSTSGVPQYTDEMMSHSYSSGGSSYSSGGNCDYSWQTDSAGRSCGGRAASVRPGGRL